MARAFVTALLLFVAVPARAGEWSSELDGFLFDPPHDRAYFSPIATADRGRLHLEARFNYENLETGSVLAGWNFSVGDEVVLDATPIVGVVMGETDGIAPGLEAEITWKRLAFSTESEYVFDFDGSDESFFYTWTEMTYALAKWVGLGAVTQKTEAYQTAREIQRGPMIEASRGPWRLGVYWFNPDRSDEGLFVGSLGYRF